MREVESWETLDGESTVFEVMCVGITENGGPDSGWLDLYINLCGYAAPVLERVRAGHTEEAAAAYRLLQVQIPYARRMAGYTEPEDIEAELRERYRIPEPAANAPAFDPVIPFREDAAA